MESKDTKDLKQNTVKYPVRALISYRLKKLVGAYPPSAHTEIVEDLEEWFIKYNSDPEVECTVQTIGVLSNDRDLLTELIKKWD